MTTFGNFNSGFNNNNYGGNNNQQQEQQQQPKQKEPNIYDKERLRLKLENPTEFKSIIQTAYADSAEFATMINGLMRTMFFDYYGVKIEPVGTQLVATVNFAFKNIDKKNIPEGYYLALENTFKKDNYQNDSMARIDMYNKYHGSVKKQNYVQLTKEAKQILMDIIPSRYINNNGTVKWNECTREQSINIIGYNTPQVTLAVEVDFIKILKIIFGDKAPNGTRYSYLPCIGKPLNPVMAANGNVIISKWQIFVLRTNNDDVKELMNSLGMTMYGINNDGIITD